MPDQAGVPPLFERSVLYMVAEKREELATDLGKEVVTTVSAIL